MPINIGGRGSDLKKILIGAGVVLLLVVGGALVAPQFVDLNIYKPEIAARVEAATGRRLVIEGDIDLRLLPAPALRVEGVRLGNLEGAAAPDMVVLKTLEVRVALLPLLGREIEVERVRLVEPVIRLETLANGRSNWRFAAAGAADGEPNATPPTTPAKGGASLPVRLEDAVVEGGTLIYRDAARGLDERVEGIDVKFSAGSLTGPFELSGALVARGLPLTVRAAVGDLGRGRSTPVSLEVALDGGAARVEFNGALAGGGPAAELAGRLKAEGDELGAAVVAIAEALGAAPRPSAPVLAGPFSLDASVAASAEEIGLNDITFTFADTSATGAFSVGLGAAPSLDGVLKINRLDVDALVADAVRAATRADATPAGADDDAAPAGVGGGFTLPDDLAGSLSLDVGALSWAGGVVRQVQVEAELGGGVVTLKRVSALAPGGSDIAVTGTLRGENGAPRFDGQLETVSDNFRAVLEWLKIDPHGLPIERMRKLQLTSALTVTPELAQIYNIDLRLDASRLTGGAAYAFRERPSFSVDFAVDRLNLEAYLPTGATGEKAEEGRDDRKDGGAPGASPGPSLAALAVLDDFDTNVRLRVGRLGLDGLLLRDFAVDASLIAGTLTVRNLAVGDIADARMALSGTVTDLADRPRFKIDAVAQVDDPGGLLRLAGLDPATPVGKLGPADVALGLEGGLDSVALELDARFAPLRLALKGSLAPLPIPARLDLSIDAQAPSLARLAAALGIDLAVPAEADRPVGLAGTVSGPVEGLEIDVAATVAGGALRVAGRVGAAAGAPTYDLAISARHPDVGALLRELGVAVRAAAGGMGGLELKAGLAGDTANARLSDLEATAGPVRLAGTASLAFAGPRPKLVADLRAGEVLADLFLPLAVTGPRGRADAGARAGARAGVPAERWSREPIDLGFLDMLDAEVTVAAAAIDVRGYAFSEPRLALSLADGVLDVTRLRGRLFDGDVDLKARIANARTPTVEIEISMAGADLEKALIQTAGIDALTGRFGFAGTFRTAGRSQFDMVSALEGDGRLSARDGVVRGIDLRRLSDRLRQIDRLPDMLALLGAATSGGQTRFTRLDGTIRVERGVIRSDDIVARLDAAEGTAAGAVDLPQWRIDAGARFRLTDHADAPPIGIDLKGPLDAPRRNIRSRELEAYLGQRLGERLLRKALGRKAAPRTQAAPRPFGAPPGGSKDAAPPPAQPVDPLQELLKRGLGGLIKQN